MPIPVLQPYAWSPSSGQVLTPVLRRTYDGGLLLVNRRMMTMGKEQRFLPQQAAVAPGRIGDASHAACAGRRRRCITQATSTVLLSAGLRGCIGVLVGRRKLVVPSPPARVGNLAQACTDRQTANAPGRRRVAGHGFSRGTANPPPPSPPPAGKVEVCPKASIPRGEGQGRGAPKTTAEAVACYTTGTWESVGHLASGRTRAPQGFHQNADASRQGSCSCLTPGWGLESWPCTTSSNDWSVSAPRASC